MAQRSVWAAVCAAASLLPVTLTAAPSTMTPTPREFRGVWVATVGNIDWPSSRSAPAAQQQRELRDILDGAARLRLNAVVFQVRPACDAFYRSELEPWSYYLSGQEGRDPGWDPLEFAVAEAHARGLELHAWFNPFRAKRGGYEHAASHIAVRQPGLVHPYGNNQQWLDPGAPGAQDHSFNVIMDAVRRYDIDAVHFDDYFYPYPEEGLPFPDDATYQAHRDGGGTLSRSDWRRDNINRFLQRLGAAIRAEKPWVRFGLSPFGIWRPGHPEGVRGLDAHESLYADSRLWLREGWVDYMAPQLYWPISSSGQPFGALLDWWMDENPRGRHIWPGLFTSRVGGEWRAAEIINQVELRQSRGRGPGTIHFSEIALRENRDGLADALREGPYAVDALVPATTWIDSQPPEPPAATCERAGDTVTVTWEPRGEETAWLWVVHMRRGDRWYHDVVPGRARSVQLPSGQTPDLVAVSSVDRLSNMSAAANAHVDRVR